MEESYRFFANKKCEYYPCHKGEEELNCLFCYCPFFHRTHCPGNPNYIKKNEKIIKSCVECVFPHKAENYDKIVKMLRAEEKDKTTG